MTQPRPSALAALAVALLASTAQPALAAAPADLIVQGARIDRKSVV